jgi:hypothetical protein
MPPVVATWVTVDAEKPEPRRKRHVGLIALGIVGLAAAATTGVVVTRDDQAGATYSLAAAAAQAEGATTVSYSMTMEMGDVANVSADVSMDLDRHLMGMTMEMDQMLDEPIAVVFDLSTGVMYMGAAQFVGMGAPIGDAEWIEFDVEDATGIDVSDMIDQVGDNPLDAAAMFDAAQHVEDLGFDEVRGEQVKHYSIEIDTATALEAQPKLRDRLEALATDMPATIVYDAYVTEANEIARLAYSLEIMGQTTTMDMVVTGVGDEVTIELPDPQTVISLNDMIG